MSLELQAYSFRQQSWRRQFILKDRALWRFGTAKHVAVRGEILRIDGGKGAVAALHTLCCRAQFGMSNPPFCMRCRTVLPAFKDTTTYYSMIEGVAVDKIEHCLSVFGTAPVADPLLLTLIAAKLQEELVRSLETAPLKNNVTLPPL